MTTRRLRCAKGQIFGSHQGKRLDRRLSDRVRWVVGLVAVLAMILPAGISFSAEENTTHEVTWLHESPAEVTSFVLFVSPVAGSMSSARQINVGKPGGSGSGAAKFYSAFVPMDANDFVAVAAIGRNGLLSELSAWSRPQPSQPGQPLIVQP